MASSTSLKELSKAINAFIVEPTVPLPESLVDTIAAYLRRHQKYDDAASDRLQEELFAIFHKHVKGNPNAIGAWFGIIRRLLPVLQTPERILQWFDACEGVLNGKPHSKGVVEETTAALMDLVTLADQYQDTPEGQGTLNPLIDRLFFAWVGRFYPASMAGDENVEHVERMVREALVNFGKRRPKEFFATLDSYFVRKQYRKASLRFLCDYIQGQPPHLHTVMQTSLFSNLLNCLQQDTSTTVVSAALTAVIMLLPHMPGALVPHLPTLFNIYARLLFWSPEGSHATEPPSQGDERVKDWEMCEQATDEGSLAMPQLSNYYTILYGLYPLNFMDYIRKPQRYLRHANVSDAEDFEVQPSEIRYRSERFRRRHLLHPNFYTLTIDTEKTDFGRWIKSDAAEVVAGCVALCLAPDSDEYGSAIPPHDHSITAGGSSDAGYGVREASEPALLSTSLPRGPSLRRVASVNTDATSDQRSMSGLTRQDSEASYFSSTESTDQMPKDVGIGSPPVRPQVTSSPSQAQLQDMLQSNKIAKSGLNQSLANDSVPSLSLSHQESTGERPATAAVTPQPPANAYTHLIDSNLQARLAHLQQQIVVLQNNLSFERYLKQQHMAHIGDLRRRQVVEAAAEAETQNLIMMNRNLKSRFEDAKKAEMQVRRESEKGRALTKKWEADLSNKLKILRDESKKTNVELEGIRRELKESRAESDKLRRMVCDAEVRELREEQSRQSAELQTVELDRLKAEVARLTMSERDHQAKELERQAAVDSASTAQGTVESLRMKLAAQENEVKRAKTLFQSQISSLQAKLGEAQEVRERMGRSAETSVKVEGDLAASRAKQAEMEKQHGLLLRKYTALQSSLLDMQSAAQLGQNHVTAAGGVSRAGGGGGGGEYGPSAVGSAHAGRARPQRGLSNPEATAGGAGAATGNNSLSPTSYNVTPALGWKNAIPTSPGSSQQRPVTPMGGADGEGGRSSPERHRGRGGIPSRVRQDSRDQQREDGGGGSGAGAGAGGSGPKDRKKSTGLRGIRGLV